MGHVLRSYVPYISLCFTIHTHTHAQRCECKERKSQPNQPRDKENQFKCTREKKRKESYLQCRSHKKEKSMNEWTRAWLHHLQQYQSFLKAQRKKENYERSHEMVSKSKRREKCAKFIWANASKNERQKEREGPINVRDLASNRHRCQLAQPNAHYVCMLHRQLRTGYRICHFPAFENANNNVFEVQKANCV